jgi:hypothetical protein
MSEVKTIDWLSPWTAHEISLPTNEPMPHKKLKALTSPSTRQKPPTSASEDIGHPNADQRKWQETTPPEVLSHSIAGDDIEAPGPNPATRSAQEDLQTSFEVSELNDEK